jgi:hypothetical protein
MSQETTALLRTILFQVKKAKTLKEAEHAVKVMCSKDDIAAVEKELAELNESE